MSERNGVVGGLIGRVVPAVIDRVDMNELLEHVDIDAVAARLDLDALIDRLDLDAVAARLDLDALIQRLDVNAVATQLDLDALIQRIDLDNIAQSLDLDALIQRLDVNAVATQLDLDVLVERLDVNAVAERIDLDELLQRIDMARLTAGATQDVATSGLDLVRRQLVRSDATVDSITRRLLRRPTDDRPLGPPSLVRSVADPPDSSDVHEPRRRRVSGHYAGPVTRLVTLGGDILGALAVSGVLGSITFYVFSLFGVDTTSTAPRWFALALGACLFLAWFWIPIGLFGRTVAMAVIGTAVVARDGGTAGGRRALVRALVLPISVTFFAIGLIGIVVGRERRALHDVAAGTVVVYDWGERDAEQPTTVRELLDAHVKQRQARAA